MGELIRVVGAVEFREDVTRGGPGRMARSTVGGPLALSPALRVERRPLSPGFEVP